MDDRALVIPWWCTSRYKLIWHRTSLHGCQKRDQCDFLRMHWPNAFYWPITACGYGPLWIRRENSVTTRSIELMVTLGDKTSCIAGPVQILIVDTPSAYNVILGWPALSAFRAVVSTFYMKIKFPTRNAIGEMLGNQVSSRKCYMQAVKEGKSHKKSIGRYHLTVNFKRPRS